MAPLIEMRTTSHRRAAMCMTCFSVVFDTAGIHRVFQLEPAFAPYMKDSSRFR